MNLTNLPPTQPSDLSREFDLIAESIMNGYALLLDRPYRLIEIEFFYYNAKTHPDCYCHRHHRRLTKNSIYFHRFANPENYKNQRSKGFDITFGDGLNYGGILVRSMENIWTKEVIQGPGKVAENIIKAIGGYKLINTAYGYVHNLFVTNKTLLIRMVKSEQSQKIYKRARVNLKPKRQDKDNFFQNAKYNYFSNAEIVSVN